MPDPPAPAAIEWTIGRLLAWTKSHFETKQLDEPRLCAELLLAKAMGLKRIELYARFDQQPSDAQRTAFRELVRAAAAYQPIAYLIGVKEFYSLEFKVTPDVLIPRPETELLVELALDWCRAHPQDRHDLLDVGTGSGCIAVAVAKRLPSVHVVATDVSEAALIVARENAQRHGVDRIAFVKADLLELPAHAVPQGGFDLIVSNPPYVAEKDRETLPDNVRKYEPSAALFAGGDGLDFYRRMAMDVSRLLKAEVLLAIEVGSGQADAVERIFVAGGRLAPLGRHKDANGIERALTFTLSA